ncbi:hypothetical protein [Aeromicrobium sp.]|uniref:hypothetical protein n=1 Tax=Aeromicrobium sp. TaxID=1871063 RepID=UPI0028AFEC96|nr:hypothetical protein [Aeromicrobium sp.]
MRVKGHTATATGMKQGTTYTFSVFTRVKKRWVGPVSVTASPRAPQSSGRPTFVAAPDTVLVPASAPVTIRPHGTRVSSTVPRGVQPVVGQAWVVPSTSRLPGGYLGRVVSIATTGTSVTLEPIGYPEAFTHLAFSVKLNSTERLRIASLTPEPLYRRPSVRNLLPELTGLADKSCGPAAGLTLSAPTARLSGSASYSFTGASFPGVPGAKVATDVSLALDWKLDMSAVEMDCRVTFHDINRAFAAGPIPMGLTASIHAKLGLSATERTSVEFSANLGVRASAELDGGRIRHSAAPYASMTSSDAPSGFAGSIKAGGDILLGPGTALPDAGLIAGLRGAFYPIELTADPIGTAEAPCLELALSSSGEADLEARAWFGPATLSGTTRLFKKTFKHWTGHLPPKCLDVPDPEPTSEPTEEPTTEPTDDPTEPPFDPGAHRLESVTASGDAAERGGREPSVSGDGRYVAYVSESSDLDPERPRTTDARVYVRDRVTGSVTPAPSTGSLEPMVRSYYPVISRDGRHVAYLQRAFVMGSLESSFVTVWDRAAGTTTVLPGDTGSAANIPEISADGSLVLYSTMNNDESSTVRLWDRGTGRSSPVSSTGEHPLLYALSPNGTSIAMTTVRAAVGEDATQAPWSMTIWNRARDTRSVVATGATDEQIALPSTVSDSGDRLVFNELASSSETASVRLWSGLHGTTSTASLPQPYTMAILPRASDDGSAVVFAALTSDSSRADVFEWNPTTGRVRRLSETPRGEAGDQLSLEPAISADGRTIVYSTAATNLVQRPSGSVAHVVSWDRSLAKD